MEASLCPIQDRGLGFLELCKVGHLKEGGEDQPWA